MSSAVELERDIDRADVPFVVRGAVKIGLITAIAVLLYSLVSRFTDGVVESALKVLVIAAGTWLVTFLPGQWTRARTIEGIAGAAGIGLGAAFVFLLLDVVLLQHIGTYTNRWWQIGGSNWWYHPIWWMVGTYLPWFGAWILANQVGRNGRISAPAAFGTAIAFALLAAVVAVLIGFPGARWNLPTFGVAFLPGLALATALSALGGRRT